MPHQRCFSKQCSAAPDSRAAIDIHGQHEHQSRYAQQSISAFWMRLAAKKIAAQRQEVGSLLEKAKAHPEEIENIGGMEKIGAPA